MMMMEKTLQFLNKEKLIWGPLFLLCIVAFGAKTAIPFDLLLLAVVGLVLSARGRLRGCCYALVLLALFAAVKHFFTTNHLWQLAIEGSLGLSYFITALSYEEAAQFFESLSQQLQMRKASLDNLEDELSKVRESALSQQITFQEKIASLQKEFEDLQTEHSSILILNEVLRKTTARAMDQERQAAFLKQELTAAEKELTRLSNTETLALQNRDLMKELNAARYEKEQTHLINETLARLYARENLRAQETAEEASALAGQLAASRREGEKIRQTLEEQIVVIRNELATLTAERDKAEQGRLALQNLREKSAPSEELAFAQKKMLHLSQIEPLFHQLRKQFEEKNQVLHQTRTNLFLADTELQKLKMEKATLELAPLPKEVEQELEDFGDQLQRLEEENLHLQELVTLLSGKLEPQPLEKKK